MSGPLLWLIVLVLFVVVGGTLFAVALGGASKRGDQDEAARRRDEAIRRWYCEQEPFDNGEDLGVAPRRIRRLS